MADAVVDEREDAVDVLLGPNVVVGKSDIANARAQCQDWAQRRRLANASDDGRELPSEGASGSADFAIAGDGVEEARSRRRPDERRTVRRKLASKRSRTTLPVERKVSCSSTSTEMYRSPSEATASGTSLVTPSARSSCSANLEPPGANGWHGRPAATRTEGARIVEPDEPARSERSAVGKRCRRTRCLRMLSSESFSAGTP